MHARVVQFKSCLIGVVGYGEHNRAGAAFNTKPVQQYPRRARQHHTGAIIVGKNQGPLDGTRCQNHLFCPHLPQPLSHITRLGIGQMVGDALAQADKVLLIIAKGRGARQSPDVRVHGQNHENIQWPLISLTPVDSGRARAQKRAAKLRALVANDNIRAALRRRQRRRQSGRPRPHHQHIAMRKPVGVMIRIRFFGRVTKPGGTADDRLINRVPKQLREHKGFIIEACGKNGREQRIHRADIKFQAWKPVLADCGQALIKLHFAGAQIGCAAPAIPADTNQCVGFIAAHRHQAARPVIFERAPHQMHAIGNQCRGQRIPPRALIGHAIKTEINRLGAVNASAGRCAHVCHQPKSFEKRAISGMGSSDL